MKAYLVWYGQYEDKGVDSVFLDRSKAELRKAELEAEFEGHEPVWISETEVR